MNLIIQNHKKYSKVLNDPNSQGCNSCDLVSYCSKIKKIFDVKDQNLCDCICYNYSINPNGIYWKDVTKKHFKIRAKYFHEDFYTIEYAYYNIFPKWHVLKEWKLNSYTDVLVKDLNVHDFCCKFKEYSDIENFNREQLFLEKTCRYNAKTKKHKKIIYF